MSELRKQKATGRAILMNSVCLGYQEHGFQGIQSLTEQMALVMKRNVLLHGGTKPEELAYFIKYSTNSKRFYDPQSITQERKLY